MSSNRIRIRFSSRQTSCSLSAYTIANNEDLLTEILLRLPIKSLLKFKSVTKHWLSIISNPQFSCRQIFSNNSPSGLFLLEYHPWNREYLFISLDSSHCSSPFKYLPFDNYRSQIKIVQSCNGLLLCWGYCRNGSNRTYYVYNPTTKQYTVLPQIRHVSGVALAFDPSKSPHYKAIGVRRHESLQHHYQIEIYSSNTGPWRVSGDPFNIQGYIEFDCGVFCNGVVHWINNSSDASLCFDVDQEQLKEIPMPEIPGDVNDDWPIVKDILYFEESRGCMNLVMNYGPTPEFNTQLDVYDVKKDYSGWFVKYRIDLNTVAAAFPEMVKSSYADRELITCAYEIICIVSGESDEDSFSMLRIPGKVIRYGFKDKSLKELCDFIPKGFEVGEENASNFVMYNVYGYIESLACV